MAPPLLPLVAVELVEKALQSKAPGLNGALTGAAVVLAVVVAVD